MHRANKPRQVAMTLALIAIFSLAFCVPAAAMPLKRADSTAQQMTPEQAKETAAQTTAEYLCRDLSKLPRVGEYCTSKARGVFLAVSDPSTEHLCEAVAPLGTRAACKKILRPIIKTVNDLYRSTYEKLIKPVVQPVIELGKTAGKVAEFAANPTDAFDRLGNKVKETAVSLAQEVFKRAGEGTNADFSRDWFRQQYARAAGLGVVVLVILLFIQAIQVAGGKITPQDFAHSVFIAAPTGILLMIFAPALGTVLSQFVDALSASIGKLTGVEVGKFSLTPAWLTASSAAAPALQGGLLVGIAVFSLMAIGSFAALVGMVLQQYGVYLVSVGLAIAWGMWVHPAWRAKTRKMLSFLVALMLMKPLFILLIGVSFAFLNDMITPAADPFSVLFALVTIAVVLVVTGFAPWVLLKYVPILPGGNEWHQSGGGATLAAGAMVLDRSLSQSRFGGAGSRTASADMTTGPAGVGPQDVVKGAGGTAARPGGSASAGAAAAPATLGASLAAALAAEAAKAGVNKARQVAGDADTTAREAEGVKV